MRGRRNPNIVVQLRAKGGLRSLRNPSPVSRILVQPGNKVGILPGELALLQEVVQPPALDPVPLEGRVVRLFVEGANLLTQNPMWFPRRAAFPPFSRTKLSFCFQKTRLRFSSHEQRLPSLGERGCGTPPHAPRPCIRPLSSTVSHLSVSDG